MEEEDCRRKGFSDMQTDAEKYMFIAYKYI